MFSQEHSHPSYHGGIKFGPHSLWLSFVFDVCYVCISFENSTEKSYLIRRYFCELFSQTHVYITFLELSRNCQFHILKDRERTDTASPHAPSYRFAKLQHWNTWWPGLFSYKLMAKEYSRCPYQKSDRRFWHIQIPFIFIWKQHVSPPSPNISAHQISRKSLKTFQTPFSNKVDYQLYPLQNQQLVLLWHTPIQIPLSQWYLKILLKITLKPLQSPPETHTPHPQFYFSFTSSNPQPTPNNKLKKSWKSQ